MATSSKPRSVDASLSVHFYTILDLVGEFAEKAFRP